jgi:hypothetical protein
MSKQRRFKRFRLLERRLTDKANRLRERAKRDEAGPVAFVDVAKFADFAGRSSHVLETASAVQIQPNRPSPDSGTEGRLSAELLSS